VFLDDIWTQSFMTHNQGCAANSLTRGSYQQAICSFSFLVLAYVSRDEQDVSIYGCLCIDILILVYRLYNLIFSVPIKGSNN
jgi:hypothetical protein